jgi:transposase
MKRRNVVFKEQLGHQVVLFPSSIGERIPQGHPVRLVDQVVDELNIDRIISTYKGGGTSSYHPRMLLKVLFYAYLNNIYSCRRIAKALEENIHFMWLSGDSTPDFRTINDFRSRRLKNQVQELFAEVVRLMHRLEYVSLETQYVDGTKIESASGRYTFVWRGSVEKNKAKLEAKIRGVLCDISQAIKQDRKAPAERQPEQVDAQRLREEIRQLNERVAELDKQAQKQVKKLAEEHLPRLEKYQQQLEKLGERNSYSKTDEDATFMRMKQDHMKNGQLKPAYNVQISTENQLITNFSLHQRAGDTATLIPHLEQFQAHYQKQSTEVVADAGYGSEQNYSWLEENKAEAFVKYNYFHQEQKKKHQHNPFLAQNLYYNEQQDFYVCPMGQHLEKLGQYERKSELGHVSTVSSYAARRCQGCPLRGQCFKGKGNRIIEVNHRLQRLKAKARERLLSQQGVYHRKQRAIEPEAVFGQVKSNNHFTRFRLRTLAKAEVDFGLAAVAHNLRKLARKGVKAFEQALKRAASGLSNTLKQPAMPHAGLLDLLSAFFSQRAAAFQLAA